MSENLNFTSKKVGLGLKLYPINKDWKRKIQ